MDKSEQFQKSRPFLVGAVQTLTQYVTSEFSYSTVFPLLFHPQRDLFDCLYQIFLSQNKQKVLSDVPSMIKQ